MKARELAAKLMEHPDADVYIEYIPYGGPPRFDVTYNEKQGYVFIDTEPDSDDDD
jgi:hypothetical protein